MEKPRYVHVLESEHNSFNFKRNELPPGQSFGYHVHPEMQLHYVCRGHGQQLIGGRLEPFDSGIVVLVPGNIPHVWRYSVRDDEKPLSSQSYMVQFHAGKVAEAMSMVPEFSDVISFITGLRDAVEIKGKAAENIAKLMKAMARQDAFERYISFLRIIRELADAPDIRYLDVVQLQTQNPRHTSKIQQIFTYLEANHDRNFTLDDIAASAGMNKSSFCKFFKMVTGHTFTEALNNIRISRAVLMLSDSPGMSISEIAYSVGYDSLSHFNHMFLKLKGESPTAYKARIISDSI